MAKGITEDFFILSRYFKKHIEYYTNKITFKFHKKMNDKKIKSQTLIETLLELEGAKRLGGEFLGKKSVLSIPVLYYRLKRITTDGSPSYYYVSYILRDSEKYQVVIVEDWSQFQPTIEKCIHSGQKASIGIRRKEGGRNNVKSRDRQGRKML